MGRPRTGWTLREPKPGRQHFTVRFTDRAGNPREYTTGEADPEQAAKRAAEIYARDLTASPTTRSRINPHLALDEHLAQWLASIETTHDPQTVVTYTAYAKRFITFFGDSLARVTVARMGDYQRTRLGAVTRSTLQKERSAFNGFLDWCVEQGLLADEHRPRWPRLPKKALGTRSGPQREAPVDLTPAQVNAFLAALPQWSKSRNGQTFAIRARFIVAYETGLRPALLDELSVPKHWRPGATEIIVEKQHDKARFGRKVPISARCAEALERTVLALGLVDGPIFGRHDYRVAVERAATEAKLPEGFAPYDLRHGRAGHLLDAGATMRAVAHLLGHRKLTTTDRYLRAQEGDARAALEAAGPTGFEALVNAEDAAEDAAAAGVTAGAPGSSAPPPAPASGVAAATAGDGAEVPGAAGPRPGFGGESGDSEGPKQGTGQTEELSMRDQSAKEGGRTPTALRPLEPESGAMGVPPRSYEHLQRQEGAESPPRSQGFGDAPETPVPDSVARAKDFLGVLRASWDDLDRFSYEYLESGDENGEGHS